MGFEVFDLCLRDGAQETSLVIYKAVVGIVDGHASRGLCSWFGTGTGVIENVAFPPIDKSDFVMTLGEEFGYGLWPKECD